MEDQIRVYYSNQSEHFITVDQANALVLRCEASWVDSLSIQLISSNERRMRKQDVIYEDNHICYLCGKKLTSKDKVTVDHIISKRSGGPLHRCNLRCCCYDCNIDKAAKSLPKYLDHVSKNKEQYPWATEEKLMQLNKIYTDTLFKVEQLQGQIPKRPALSLD